MIHERLNPIIDALIELGLLDMADELTEIRDEIKRREEEREP